MFRLLGIALIVPSFTGSGMTFGHSSETHSSWSL